MDRHAGLYHLVIYKTRFMSPNGVILLTELARALAWRCGINFTRLTPQADMIELVQMLKPYYLGLNLIRLGGDHDGGYLLPDDLEGIHYCFSPGVSNTVDFEIDLLDRSIFSFLADHSIDHPPASLKNCSFEKKNIGIIDTEHTISLETWVRQNTLCEPSSDLLLQMDIEGAEFDVLLSTPKETLQRFRIIIVEFHSFHQIANPQQYNLMLKVFTKLLSLFDVAHVHPNNCCGSVFIRGLEVPRILEFTLLRKDRVREKRAIAKAPHRLDRPNVVNKNDLILPTQWYK
jgi:hypothetical protein